QGGPERPDHHEGLPGTGSKSARGWLSVLPRHCARAAWDAVFRWMGVDGRADGRLRARAQVRTGALAVRKADRLVPAHSGPSCQDAQQHRCVPVHGGSHRAARGPRQAYRAAIGACEGVHHVQNARDGLLGARAARRQRHPRRLQRCALLRGRRGALFLRRHLSDAAPDRRQGGHRVQRFRLAQTLDRRYAMASPAVAVGVETQHPPAPKLDNVLYEKRSGVAYVTLNRPKVLNALNSSTWKDLRTAFEDARDDTAVRGVILTGAGDMAFIAGADISELAHA